jgi:amino acid adenylation domain-containing protein
MAVTDYSSRRSLTTAAMDSRLPVHSYGPRGDPRFLTVTDAFYHHAVTQPDAVAATDLTTGNKITYQDLAIRASYLASRLRQVGVSPGDKVPLVVKRGIDMLVGILAVLSCGAQYVPLDGGVVPDKTLRVVVEQAGGSVVLVLNQTKHRLDIFGNINMMVIDDQTWPSERPYGGYVNLAKPEDGCYVIYTSGTTGAPKGVDVSHINVTNLVCQSPGDLGITRGTRVGQTLNISFDMAAWEILGCLSNGGTLMLRGSDWKVAVAQINVLICTPSILAKYNPQEYPDIKTVATAGEPSSQRLADAWALNKTYYNCCGPTETTIVNTMHRHVSGGPLTIGKPTANNNVYILDEDMRPVAEGESGVMWAGGLGVSRGYVGLPEKTAEKYRVDEFAGSFSHMYNTGDLGRWLPDGSIDILGRVDDQIKFKGFRIELDGLTASLNACPEVDRGVAMFHDGEIQAWVSPRHCDVAAVKLHMERCQPYYAVPSRIHTIAALPLTGNGKIDKRALKDSLLVPNRNSIDSHTTNETIVEEATISKPETAVVVNEKDHVVGVIPASASIPSSPSASTLVMSSEDEGKFDIEAAMPDKIMGKRERNLRNRVFIVYRRLFTLIGLINIGGALAVIFTGFPREWVGNITAMNLVLAVMMRQEHVVNVLYDIACSVPLSSPLWLRVRLARIFHFGGVHSGAGVSAALWLLANNIGDVTCMVTDKCDGDWGRLSIASKTISWVIAACFIVMLTLAWPDLRKKYHNSFEMVHRFIGWTLLGLFWAQTVVSANDLRGDMSLGDACVRSPPFWLLVVATICVASSWFWLKKVKVEAEVLSDHALRLHFDYTVPVNGSFVRLSEKPLAEWHSFATVPAPTRENGRPLGFSVVISNAGDWTKKHIQAPPERIWVRGVPVNGVMNVSRLFNRVVLVGTGSGIGPLLGHIQTSNAATQLIWSTPRPEETFGKGIIEVIRRRVPDAVIHDTKKLGRPDLTKMAYNLAKNFRAEAVLIIANEKITKKVVYGLETRGMPAFGAIWDS